jgi:hypothetical protein
MLARSTHVGEGGMWSQRAISGHLPDSKRPGVMQPLSSVPVGTPRQGIYQTGRWVNRRTGEEIISVSDRYRVQ